MHPEVIDDRAALPNLTVPTLVVVGRYDVICGVRWAEELHMLIQNLAWSCLSEVDTSDALSRLTNSLRR